MIQIIKKIICKIKHKKVCKLNGYYCPDCIYHDFIWENDIIFRGNRCKFPLYIYELEGENDADNKTD